MHPQKPARLPAAYAAGAPPQPPPQKQQPATDATRPVIVLFRNDLRLTDNPALHAALATKRPVLPVYVHPPIAEQGGWPLGGAAKLWLHHSLASLDARLRDLTAVHCQQQQHQQSGAPRAQGLLVLNPERASHDGALLREGELPRGGAAAGAQCGRSAEEVLAAHRAFETIGRLGGAAGGGGGGGGGGAGSTAGAVRALARACRASAVYWNRCTEPWFVDRDAAMEAALRRDRVAVRSFKAVVLFEAGEVNPEAPEFCAGETCGDVHSYGSVGFFRRACEGREVERALPPPPPRALVPLAPSCRPPPRLLRELGEGLCPIGLARMPRKRTGATSDWAAPLVAFWGLTGGSPAAVPGTGAGAGEPGAHAALDRFLSHGIWQFEEADERFKADAENTARLSPYVRFGEVSARTIYNEVARRHGVGRARTFLRRLVWRDLAYWMLRRFPAMPDRSLRPHYEAQRWTDASSPKGAALLAAWQRGRTGYPLVDAAMTQLWRAGWMPNYMRHVVAGFLVEFLGLDWRHGEKWFHDTLVDADVAINAYMWQNGGHSGVDQWNFVMHPVFAAKKADPDGDYVRKWLPQLAALPAEYIHCPWEAPITMLAGCGLQLGGSSEEPLSSGKQQGGGAKTLATAVAIGESGGGSGGGGSAARGSRRRGTRGAGCAALQGHGGPTPVRHARVRPAAARRAATGRASYPRRVLVDLEAARLESLRAVVDVRRSAYGAHFVLEGSGNEWLELPPHDVGCGGAAESGGLLGGGSGNGGNGGNGGGVELAEPRAARRALLITRVDYREMALKPLTEQRAGDKWDARTRKKAGALNEVMHVELHASSNKHTFDC